MELEGIVAKMAEQVKLDKKRIVLPETEDKRVLAAAAIVAEGGYADIVLIGNKEEIEKVCDENNISMPWEKVEVVDNNISTIGKK